MAEDYFEELKHVRIEALKAAATCWTGIDTVTTRTDAVVRTAKAFEKYILDDRL